MYHIVIVNLPKFDLIMVTNENGGCSAGEKVRWNDDITREQVITRLKKVYKIKNNEE